MWRPAAIGIATIISLASVPAQASFCGEIEKLVRLSKDQFSSILGPRNDVGSRVAYKSKYVMPKADVCIITEVPQRGHRPMKRRLLCSWEFDTDESADRAASLEAYRTLFEGVRECSFLTVSDREDIDGDYHSMTAWHRESGQSTEIVVNRSGYGDGTYYVALDVSTALSRR